jgi:C4-dicarboxylate-specific signal transduction histidine kinase
VDDAGPNVFGVSRKELERLRAISGLAATFAHNINQPLTAASAYLRAAQRLTGGLPKESVAPIVGALDKAVMQIMRAGQVVRSLSELVAQGEPDKTLVSVNSLIEETLSLFDAEAAEAGVSISKRLTKDDDCIVADRVQISHVLANLIRNAIEAMQDLPRRELVVSTQTQAAKAIRVEVQDTGCGPGGRDNADPLDLFAMRKEGMGIGLSISRAIVEAHDGRLWAKVNPEGGAIFSCDLPLRGREFSG